MNAYVVVRSNQTALEAENADDAVKRVLAGEGVSSGASFNVQIRAPQPQPQKAPNAPAPTTNP